MNVVLWIVAGLLALVYLGAGALKLSRSQDKLAENPNFGWVKDMPSGAVKAIGAVELLGAVGLIVPEATGLATVLTPLAATGLAIVQIGAAITHLRRGEVKSVPVNVVLFALAAFVAVARFMS